MVKNLGFVTVLVALVLATTSLWAAEAKNLPTVGAAAPEFNLTNDKGAPVKLADYRGKWVVLYFYPRDMTSGCTVEAHNFQTDLAKYQALNAVVLGVSVDSADSHQAFAAKEGLEFGLLSDPDAKTSTAYGSLMSHQGVSLSARNTFIIDKEGKIARVFTGVNPATHSAEVLAALAGLQAAK